MEEGAGAWLQPAHKSTSGNANAPSACCMCDYHHPVTRVQYCERDLSGSCSMTLHCALRGKTLITWATLPDLGVVSPKCKRQRMFSHAMSKRPSELCCCLPRFVIACHCMCCRQSPTPQIFCLSIAYLAVAGAHRCELQASFPAIFSH